MVVSRENNPQINRDLLFPGNPCVFFGMKGSPPGFHQLKDRQGGAEGHHIYTHHNLFSRRFRGKVVRCGCLEDRAPGIVFVVIGSPPMYKP